jgi:hypothetical protein
MKAFLIFEVSSKEIFYTMRVFAFAALSKVTN